VVTVQEAMRGGPEMQLDLVVVGIRREIVPETPPAIAAEMRQVTVVEMRRAIAAESTAAIASEPRAVIAVETLSAIVAEAWRVSGTPLRAARYL
jgi:hypothetical protein